jgi:putative selenate reductase
MSDLMQPLSFEELLRCAMGEYRAKKSIFGISRFAVYPDGSAKSFLGKPLEAPFGPAAGPHTQMAQNIVACYLAGARFFELKTVQTIDGEELSSMIDKPCIAAKDEAYNCEWSTELTVEQARDEYVKAFILCRVLCREFSLGDPDAFQFNLSVGYDLKGIQSEKIDTFLNTLMDAGSVPVFQESLALCRQAVRDGVFLHVSQADLDAIPSCISNSVTLSTMHGCRPSEIEAIADYLLTEKHLNTYVKLNPTLLGYSRVRRLLDDLGYSYVEFDRKHFDEDLQMEDAVPMLRRLMDVGRRESLTFGVKLTNTFPVRSMGEVAGSEMYLSGKALYPLSLGVAVRLHEALPELPVSYCGGADGGNTRALVDAGLCPVTMATVLLQPAGFTTLTRIAGQFTSEGWSVSAIDGGALSSLAGKAQPKGKGPRNAVRERKEELLPDPDHEQCPMVCGICTLVCPNRANVMIGTGKERFVLHLDRLCNECGNCSAFCSYGGNPYRDRLTFFSDEEAFNDSTNRGFVFTKDGVETSDEGLEPFITAVQKEAPYLPGVRS